MTLARQNVVVLGSTGSIGESTLDVLLRHPNRFRVFALQARRNHARLLEQCERARPEWAALTDPEAARSLEQGLKAKGLPTRVMVGDQAAVDLARHAETHCVMAAIVGAAGLASALAAAASGKRLLIANKESLVMAGRLVLAAAQQSGAQIIPIDSEHNAIFQCLPLGTPLGQPPVGVRRILLTASGGPFRDWTAERIHSATADQACAHPVWSMGRKISVDSATLMNKGLELIEAHLLFGVPTQDIQIVVHRQSVVHSLVEYVDGSVLAQLGSPDMRTPIAQALAAPQRIEAGVQSLDLIGLARLDFEAPDPKRFPCLRLAREAAEAGWEWPVVLNAANELAVASFLEGGLNFGGIPEVIERIMQQWQSGKGGGSLAEVLDVDARARLAVLKLLPVRPRLSAAS